MKIMGMRETVILILGLVVVAVILRGLYLALQARRGQIRLAIDRNIPHDVDLEELEMAELPSGGARVVQRSLAEVNRQNSTQDELDLGGEAAQSGPIPMLMDSVEIRDGAASYPEDEHNGVDEDYDDEGSSHFQSELSGPSEEGTDYSFSAEFAESEQDGLYQDSSQTSGTDNEQVTGPADQGREGPDDFNAAAEESTDSAQTSSEFDFGDDDSGRSEPTLDSDKSFEEEFGDYSIEAVENDSERPEPEATTIEPDSFSDTDAEREPTHVTRTEGVGEVTNINQAKETRKSATASEVKTAKAIEPAEVLVVNVMSKEGGLFRGAELLQALITTGLKHGDMDIFHKHADHANDDAIVFSVANILNPGTFDLSDMDGFSTRGVSLFFSMPATIGNLEAFEQMLKTAQQIRGALDGELKDDHRNVMTAQTIEHYRQRIHDFELRTLKSTQARS